MEKIDYEHGTFVILTNEADYDDFPYEEYVMECEDLDIKPGSRSSYEYAVWVQEQVDANWESDLENIETCKEYNVPVTITGELGLWDGRHTIEPVEMNSVYDAVIKCIGRGASYVTAYFENGKITVNVHHHDGCNCFTITAKERLPYLYNL